MPDALPPAADGGPRRLFVQRIAAAGFDVHPEDLPVRAMYTDPGRYGWEQLATVTWTPATKWGLTVLWRHVGTGIVNLAFDRNPVGSVPFHDPAYLWEHSGEVVDIGVLELHCAFGLDGAPAEEVPRLHAEIVGMLDVVRPLVPARSSDVAPWIKPWDPTPEFQPHGDCCR